MLIFDVLSAKLQALTSCIYIAGPSVGIDQSVFAVVEDTFLNLDTGDIWQLNNTQYITFNRSLDGLTARNYFGVGPNQTLQYVPPATFYSGGAGLDYQQIAPPAIATPSNATSNSTKPVYATATQQWTKVVERLYYYTELVTLQASVTTPCSNDSRCVLFYHVYHVSNNNNQCFMSGLPALLQSSCLLV